MEQEDLKLTKPLDSRITVSLQVLSVSTGNSSHPGLQKRT